MTNQHPLTDEIIDEITYDTRCTPEPGELVFNFDDVRAAADWQLERCTEELDHLLYVFAISGAIDEAGRKALLGLFKEAMRPQKSSPC